MAILAGKIPGVMVHKSNFSHICGLAVRLFVSVHRAQLIDSEACGNTHASHAVPRSNHWPELKGPSSGQHEESLLETLDGGLMRINSV